MGCDGVRHWYDAPVGGVPSRNEMLPASSLELGRTHFEAVVGEGGGPIALLRCIAGLVVPREGVVEWRDAEGLQVPRPRVGLVHAAWRPYDCYTVRDVLEHAVPPGTGQEVADALVGAALRLCLPALPDGRRATDLPRPLLSMLGVAAAVASGCGWILVEVDGGGRAGRDRRRADPVLARLSAVRRLVRGGWKVILGGTADGCAAWAPRRVHRLPEGGAGSALTDGCAARVAEGAPVATVSAPT